MTVDNKNIEILILKCLFENDLYARKFIETLKPEIFSTQFKNIVTSIQAYYKKYHKIASIDVLIKAVLPKYLKGDEEKINDSIKELDDIRAVNIDYKEIEDFINEETKKYIKTQRIMQAMVKAIELVGDPSKQDQIISLLDDAYKVTFDDSFGIEYFEDLEQRLERSKEVSKPIPSGLKTFDDQIGGGYRRDSLVIFAAAANTGKTLFLNDAAVNMMLKGYNVLYLSLELSQDYIAQRSDAKFAETNMNSINASPEAAIKKAIQRRDILKKNGKKVGSLYYKDYPPNSVSCNEIRALIKNLDSKKGFKPDFIIIDYLKLLRPQGKTYGDNLYSKLGTVCEELRGLAREYNAVVLTAAQTGRQSYGSTSIGMEDVGDSIAIPQTADVLVTLARDTTLDTQNLILVTVVKSRFSKNNTGTFTITADYDYMRLVDNNSFKSHNDYKKKEVKKTSTVATTEKEDRFLDEVMPRM